MVKGVVYNRSKHLIVGKAPGFAREIKESSTMAVAKAREAELKRLLNALGEDQNLVDGARVEVTLQFHRKLGSEVVSENVLKAAIVQGLKATWAEVIRRGAFFSIVLSI